MSPSRSAITTPLHLRRSQQKCFSDPLIDVTLPRYDCNNPAMDVGVRLPTNPFYNRFEILAEPDAVAKPAVKHGGRYQISGHDRRARQFRGTRERKRRRNSRRAERKRLGAASRKERLSRDVDAIWSQAKPMQPQWKNVSLDGDDLPRTNAERPIAMKLPTTPQQLPPFEFDRFSLDAFPTLPAPSRTASPHPTSSVISLPVLDWLFDKPPLRRNAISYPKLPVSYDLSSLSEPISKQKLEPSNSNRELQLWQPSRNIEWLQQSPLPRNKMPALQVKLPPVSYEQPSDYLGKQNMPSTVCQDKAMARRGDIASGFTVGTVVDSKKIPDPIVEKLGALKSDAETTNLWNLANLSEQSAQPVEDDASYFLTCYDPHFDTFKLPIQDDTISRLTSCDAHFDTFEPTTIRLPPPPHSSLTLAGKEVPFVHPNALTDLSSDLAVSPYGIEHPALKDSAVCFGPMIEPTVLTDELTVDHDSGSDNQSNLASVVMRPLTSDMEPVEEARAEIPTSKGSADLASNSAAQTTNPSNLALEFKNTSLSLADVLPVECIASDTTSHIENHYQDDSSLFTLVTPPALSRQSSHSAISLTDCLTLGHSPECWCGSCDGGGEPDLFASDKIIEDEGWLICSSTDDGESVATQLSGETGGCGDGVPCVGRENDVGWDDIFSAETCGQWEVACANGFDALRCRSEALHEWDWEW